MPTKTLPQRTPMLVHVIEEHISRGKRKQCSDCPVALAMKDAGCVFPLVDYALIWGPAGARLSMETPEAVGVFITRFDQGLPVAPFDFEVVVRL